MGDFPDSVIQDAFSRCESKCERCNNTVHEYRRGDRASKNGWEALPVSASGGDTLSNCEILCFPCHDKTS